jgi:hypothetical protein
LVTEEYVEARLNELTDLLYQRGDVEVELKRVDVEQQREEEAADT